MAFYTSCNIYSSRDMTLSKYKCPLQMPSAKCLLSLNYFYKISSSGRPGWVTALSLELRVSPSSFSVILKTPCLFLRCSFTMPVSYICLTHTSNIEINLQHSLCTVSWGFVSLYLRNPHGGFYPETPEEIALNRYYSSPFSMNSSGHTVSWESKRMLSYYLLYLEVLESDQT